MWTSKNSIQKTIGNTHIGTIETNDVLFTISPVQIERRFLSLTKPGKIKVTLPKKDGSPSLNNDVNTYDKSSAVSPIN